MHFDSLSDSLTCSQDSKSTVRLWQPVQTLNKLFLVMAIESIAISLGISLQRESSMGDGGETRGLGSKVDSISPIVGISISRPLGSVDSTNRVSSIDSRSSIAIGGVVSNSGRLSITTDGNTTSNSRGGMGSIVSSISGISMTISSIAEAISTIVSISISRPLAIVSKSIAISGGISLQRESSMRDGGETRSLGSKIDSISTIVSISISRPLGSVDSADRVSSIDSRSSIAIGSIVSNSHGLSITTDSNTTSNSRSSMGAIVSSISSIAQTVSMAISSIAIGSIEGISLSSNNGCKAGRNSESEHDSCL